MSTSPQCETRDSKCLRGNASQFFVAGELCRRGVVAVVTMGNCPNTDILCSNTAGTHFAHIQVKTFVPSRPSCSVGMKAEHDYGTRFFWVLAGIPHATASHEFVYYIVPSAEMAIGVRESHGLWLSTPGLKGQAHDSENKMRVIHLPPKVCRSGWNLEQYRNRWDLILDSLAERTARTPETRVIG